MTIPSDFFAWALLIGGILFIVLPLVFALLVMLPFGAGSVLLASQGNPDPAFLKAWFAGIALLAVVLFALFLLVGFLRLSWLFWGNLFG